MPDILSHLLCADETASQLDEHHCKIIKIYRKTFNLGAQGPDVFFYYKIYPWKNANNFGDYGTKLHQEKPFEFFLKGADLIKEKWTSNDLSVQKETHQKFAYLAGFLSHYAFDTTAHPFIFYFSGIKGGYNHKYYESILDTILMKQFQAKDKKLNNTGKTIQLNASESHLVSTYLSTIISSTYDVTIDPEAIQIAIKDMSSIMRIMYDPMYLKRHLLKHVDRLTHAKGKIITAIFPARLDENIDYLNTSHIQWCNPCDKHLTSRADFVDLFHTSIHKSKIYIEGLMAYIENQIDSEELKAIIGNNLYDTGLDAELNATMTYENVILDFKKYDKKKKQGS